MRLLGSVLSALFLAGCMGGGSENVQTVGDGDAAAAAEPPPCGEPAAVEPTPAGDKTAPGARAGPLWFVFGGNERAEAALEPAYPRKIFPTKVMIAVRGTLDGPVSLRGWRCADGQPLRLWYRGDDLPRPSDGSFAPEALAKEGEVVARLPDEPTIGAPPGYGGYMLFTTPGKWVVSVYGPDRLLGTVVVQVNVFAAAAADTLAVSHAGVPLPRRCRPALVKERIVSMLDAFNHGRGGEFARGFLEPSFHPYTAAYPGAGFTDERAIARFVSERHAAGDGWTATRLDTPLDDSSGPDVAVYLVTFRLSQNGTVVGPRAAKVVVDCDSGLLDKWAGPALGPPDVPAG